MNGRIYDAQLGRFLSADVLVQFPGSLQSFNRYSYVHNNPLSFTDPSGFTAENKRLEETEWEKWMRLVQENSITAGPGRKTVPRQSPVDPWGNGRAGLPGATPGAWVRPDDEKPRTRRGDEVDFWSPSRKGLVPNTLPCKHDDDLFDNFPGVRSAGGTEDKDGEKESTAEDQATVVSDEAKGAADEADAPNSAPSAVGVVADAVAGAGIPTIVKDRVVLGSTTGLTSPASIIARGTPLSNVNLPVRVPTPTYTNINASTSNLGALAGRAGPVVGLGVGVVVIATSDNPWRTAVGTVFGIGGGAIGATAGVIASAPTGGLAVPITGTAGALAGSYAGNQLGLGIYDTVAGWFRPSTPTPPPPSGPGPGG
jgi:hypothetical protein